MFLQDDSWRSSFGPTLLGITPLFTRNSWRPLEKLRELIRINQPFLGKEEIDAAVEVLRSGILTDKSGMGPRVLEFERSFAKFVSAKHAVAVVYGTAAIHASLLAADVGPGDEVI